MLSKLPQQFILQAEFLYCTVFKQLHFIMFTQVQKDCESSPFSMDSIHLGLHFRFYNRCGRIHVNGRHIHRDTCKTMFSYQNTAV